MKKLSFILIVLSFSIIFGACPPLEEDDADSTSSAYVLSIDDPDLNEPGQDTPDLKLDVYKWFKILDKIATEGKYVSLDLSKGIYVEGNENNGGGGLSKVKIDGVDYIAFDPFPASSSGKKYIVSITLPTVTQIIKQAVEIKPTDKIDEDKYIEYAKRFSAFRSFTNLRSVKANNVTNIGNFAFIDCINLTDVDFPRVGHTVKDEELLQTTPGYSIDIGKYAFFGCVKLKEVKFNSAAVIGGYAFKDCISLSKIDFPEVWMIENNVFEGCISLVNVFFEKASKIGEKAFKDCISLKKAEFNVASVHVLSGVFPDDLTDFKTPPINYSDIYDSVIFYPSVFTGCKALETLNVRNAWNVYFSEDVLENIGAAIDIYLLDEIYDAPTKRSYGHPQNAEFLGKNLYATVKNVNILVPVIDPLKEPARNANIQGNKAEDNIAFWLKTQYVITVSVIPR